MAGIYRFTAVKEATTEDYRSRFTFDLIGELEKSLLRFSYDAERQAESARRQMQEAIANVVEIVPL
jgi:hypothetical protein